MNKPPPQEIVDIINKSGAPFTVSYFPKISENMVMVAYDALDSMSGDAQILIDDTCLRPRFACNNHIFDHRYKRKFNYIDYPHLNDMIPVLITHMIITISHYVK